MGHVLARLSGHGLVLLPFWPFTFERHSAGRDAVAVTRRLPSGPRQALVDPAAPGGHDGIVDVAEGPGHPYWLIETSQFAMPWPDGYAIESPAEAGDRTPFYLHGPAGQLIFPQGPATVSGPDALVADDQTVVDRRGAAGAEIVEVVYPHDGEQWWQAHFLLPHDERRTLVLTAQARHRDAAGARTAAEFMVGHA